MAPSVKNSKTNQLINPMNWNNRVPSPIDSQNDFFNKSNASFHGYAYSSGKYMDTAGAIQNLSGGSAYPATIFMVGPYNEITIQSAGGSITITGSIDGTNFVSVNTLTSADGFTRIQSLYRFIKIVATGLNSASYLYMQVW